MPLFDCDNPFVGRDRCFCARNIGIGERGVDIFIVGVYNVGEDGERSMGLARWLWAVDLVHEAVEVVDPIVEVVVWLELISWLRGSSRKTIWAMRRAGDMDEREVKGEDRHDPAIDARARFEIGVRQHSFDIPRIYFDNQVANSYQVHLEDTQSAKETVELELGLGETRFAVVERDRTEPSVVADAGVVEVALAEVEADCEVRGVDCEDDIGRRGIVDWAKGR